MPLYEYICLQCQHRFEVLVKMNQTEIVCPRCQSHQVKKLISSFGIGGPGRQSKGGPSGSNSCSNCSSSSCSTCRQ
ncbi:MAG TPA: zinc ribbon domain-containing protein [Candidatus Saccharicenans sp.]|nr:zinc ribbon domain-containing protein [Candidatus Saccharicenans sp.]HQO75065.1 zinc ribbon domain-containing protein [Candidatus Saccharicenans sp.]HUM79030.1 zinc ribbon domain-containing protein [Candidatus Saccharicenans sp.]